MRFSLLDDVENVIGATDLPFCPSKAIKEEKAKEEGHRLT
jgi:hypothetical protein